VRIALVALAACSSAPATKQPDYLANTPSGSWRGVAPKVARDATGLVTRGLPAIADDGSRIVAAFRESDGDRGLPNLTLVIKDRSDKHIDIDVVLSVAEADKFLDDADGKNPALDARVNAANQWLHDHHVVSRFVPLAPLTPDPEPIPADRTRATGDNLVVEWTQTHLRITDRGDALVDIDTPKSWLPEQPKVGANACMRSAYLGGAAVDRMRKLALVTISYTADSDFCLAPSDQHHVITW
jgi:hypothetical protein